MRHSVCGDLGETLVSSCWFLAWMLALETSGILARVICKFTSYKFKQHLDVSKARMLDRRAWSPAWRFKVFEHIVGELVDQISLRDTYPSSSRAESDP